MLLITILLIKESVMYMLLITILLILVVSLYAHWISTKFIVGAGTPVDEQLIVLT